MSDKKGLKVIGAGWGRTGTASMKKALEMLGYNPTYHMFEVLNNPTKHIPLWGNVTRSPLPSNADEFINKYSEFVYPVNKETAESKMRRFESYKTIFDGYEATVDFPAALYFKDLMELYPDAKVILSIRDFESWYRSVMNTILHFHPLNQQALLPIKALGYIVPYDRSMTTIANFYSPIPVAKGKNQMEIAFNAWIEHVKQVVPKEKLLVVQVGKEGWKPFCDFLQVQKCPTEPFPHVHEEAEFIQLTRNISIAFYGTIFFLCFLALFIIRRISKSCRKHEKKD